MKALSNQGLAEVAVYFQALGEPMRLRLLNLLREGERNVGDLAQECGTTPANVSRHLSLLMTRGLVLRESRGTSAYYRIADRSVYKLCDLVCGNIASHHARSAREEVAAAAPAARRAGSRRVRS